jgi:hypothetical protein
MSTFAHVAGVPLEELLPSVAGAGGSLLLARAWLMVHLRRAGKPER